jgi:hypothetical protein
MSSDLFKIQGINSFASAGTGWSVSLDPGRRLDAHLAETAAEIDEHLTAETPPIQVDPITGRYPQVLVGLNARMAARAAVISLQIENAAYRKAVDRLFEREKQDLVMLDNWRKGKPLNPRPVDTTPGADNSARAGYFHEPIPWLKSSL